MSEEKTTSEAENENIEVPAKFKDLIEKIETMSVLDLSELVKVLEKKFGVSAQVMAAMPMMAGAVGGEAAAAPEKSSFTVELSSAGDQKIQVIKVLKEAFGLGLKEAKDLVDAAPSVLKEGVKKDEAEEVKKKIEAVGGSVTLK
ncbi:MAG: 50S ribosomal protein L7/L12 [Parcubacteria group bacterium]|nr:50S ribosomal protein L7/L12 [Parcubacteria group bacterium]